MVSSIAALLAAWSVTVDWQVPKTGPTIIKVAESGDCAQSRGTAGGGGAVVAPGAAVVALGAAFMVERWRRASSFQNLACSKFGGLEVCWAHV